MSRRAPSQRSSQKHCNRNLYVAPGHIPGAALGFTQTTPLCTGVQVSQQPTRTTPKQINHLPRGAERATGSVMRQFALALFFCLQAFTGATHCLAASQEFLREAAETNVNQRYLIESVSVAGVAVQQAKIPSSLRQKLGALIGARCDMAILEDLASQLRRELHLQAATEKLTKGSQPDFIRVNFDVVQKDRPFEIAVPKFLYHSSQGWTGEVDATARAGANAFRFGIVGNGDDLTERFTGYSARLENASLDAGRTRLAITFEDFHNQWNRSTRNAVAEEPSLDLYRSRRNIAPEVTFAVNKNLSVSSGMSFQSMESEAASIARRAANAITASARWAGHGLDLRYSLRAGLRGLGSDYGYSRQAVSARYEVKSGRQTVADEIQAGTLTGEAPFFERFILGSSVNLRGWNRYSIAPLGGTRMAHNSLSWAYRMGNRSVETFYDAGSLSGPTSKSKIRHSVGAGYRQGIFVLTVAFPVVEGRMTPVFMAGMNY
ncbi:MAG: hypothetical protein JWN34_2703 [Bryobacterales bacterium]|jgi:hypothetical protein|nr:hypothetical protein [Bryobacterales bacterium]